MIFKVNVIHTPVYIFYIYIYILYNYCVWVGDVAACIYYIIMYMRLKPLNGQVHRKKTWFYPKTRVFWISQISISALSHEVLPLMLKIQQCSYQHAASVLCRARDFVGKLFLHFSHACPTTFLRLNAPTNNVNFCIPGIYATTWIA